MEKTELPEIVLAAEAYYKAQSAEGHATGGWSSKPATMEWNLQMLAATTRLVNAINEERVRHGHSPLP